MYRKSLERDSKMGTAEEVWPQEYFLTRVGNLPIVNDAIGQLTTFYGKTKESNRLVKYTLETAESGVKVVAITTMPVVNKFEKPIGALNNIACSQLDKLEEKYPVITQPTDKVLQEVQPVYEATLKPTVDRVGAATQYGLDKARAATQYGIDTVEAVNQYRVDKVNAVKEASTNKVNNVKNYTTETIYGVGQYSMDKLTVAKDYGEKAIQTALQTSMGQVISTQVDGLLDITDQYVEKYLPEEEAEEGEEPAMEVDEVEKDSGRLGRVTTLSDKVRHRMYKRAMRQLHTVQLRSRETIDKLNFTVDLMAYAQDNFEGAQDKVAAARARFGEVWEEINMTEEEAEQAHLAREDKEHYQADNATLERRAIVTARHLTLKLKTTLSTIASSTQYLPTVVQDKIAEGASLADSLYYMFTTTKVAPGDVPAGLVGQAKETLTYMQETLGHLTDYIIASRPVSWLIPLKFLPVNPEAPQAAEMTEMDSLPKDKDI